MSNGTQWYAGTAEIEIGGQQLEVVFHYLPNSDSSEVYDPEEVHWKACRLLVAVALMGGATHLSKLDITDLCIELHGDFWDLADSLLREQAFRFEPVEGNEVDE